MKKAYIQPLAIVTVNIQTAMLMSSGGDIKMKIQDPQTLLDASHAI